MGSCSSKLLFMYICGIAWNTRCSGCAIATVLLSIYSHLRQFLGGHITDAARPKHSILFADVTSLNSNVTSYVTQHSTCIGLVTFYYKRAADTSVGGGSCLLFVRSSGLTLSPETCMWLVPNACRSRCV